MKKLSEKELMAISGGGIWGSFKKWWEKGKIDSPVTDAYGPIYG